MSTELTLSIIKPDAVAKSVIGAIYSRFEKAGLNIVAAKMAQLSREQAEGFYAVHKERGFFGELISFMVSGPIVAIILEKDNAIEDFRTLIGATNPENAAEGTIRKKYAKSIDANAVHGSDSNENAAIEGSYFFSEFERF